MTSLSLHEYANRKSQYAWIKLLNGSFLAYSVVWCTHLNATFTQSTLDVPQDLTRSYWFHHFFRNTRSRHRSRAVFRCDSKHDPCSLQNPQPRLIVHGKQKSHKLFSLLWLSQSVESADRYPLCIGVVLKMTTADQSWIRNERKWKICHRR